MRRAIASIWGPRPFLPFHTVAVAAVAAALAVVAFASLALPARAVGRVDPATTLRG